MFEKLKEEIGVKAEEYARTKHCEKCSTGHCEKKCILVEDDCETFKDGFLAGLKAGRASQWHDLRKDKNDLPEKLKLGFSRTVVNQIGTPCHYNYALECWQNWSFIKIETPIAWCEIPAFDKE